MKGSGEFVGEGAYEEFKRLATVYYDGGEGVLVHPCWQSAHVYFAALSLAQAPRPDYGLPPLNSGRAGICMNRSCRKQQRAPRLHLGRSAGSGGRRTRGTGVLSHCTQRRDAMGNCAQIRHIAGGAPGMESRHQNPQLHYDGTEGACDIMEAVVTALWRRKRSACASFGMGNDSDRRRTLRQFYLKCPYHAAQAALLERAWRVTLQEKGAVFAPGGGG